MKKSIIILAIGIAFYSCNKAEKIEDKELEMEKHMEGNNTPMDGNNIEDLDSFRQTVNRDIKKGDSIVVADLKKEIQILRMEIESLKGKKRK